MSKGLISVLIVLFSFFSHSHAETIKTTNELTLGVFPYISSTRLIRLYMPLTQYLESKTNKKVRLLSAPDFKTFIQRTNTQQYDIIYTAPHFALLAEQQKKYKRLSRFSRDLTGTLFVNADSPITRIEELEGKTVSMPDELAIISVMGEVHLKKNGLYVGRNISLLNTPTHNNAIISVNNNTASAGI
ncbi:MAG: phosphate/phosphite/phosphonate ABC transporter substrate-binding protein, partial [Gammaproteobacteria bacterium]|nr:phosphate/phosphite/phosphonate ABC transporter substrate-binding protein [Gammaproteobacteria bacterium]